MNNSLKSKFQSRLNEDRNKDEKLYTRVQNEKDKLNTGRPPVSKLALNQDRFYKSTKVNEVQLNHRNSSKSTYELSSRARPTLLNKKSRYFHFIV
jgi:hypothetical protein